VLLLLRVFVFVTEGVFAADVDVRVDVGAMCLFSLPDRSGGGEGFPVVGFREEGKESSCGARLIAPHQFLDSGIPDAVLKKDAEVPAGAGPPVVDRRTKASRRGRRRRSCRRTSWLPVASCRRWYRG